MTSDELVLKIEDVSKKFGGLQALNLVNFNVYKGQIKGLIGPNGAGKSTLLNIISRFYAPDFGKVYFLGENLLSYPSYQVAKIGVGRTFQMVQFMGDLTVIECVMIGVHSLTKKGITSSLLKLPSERKEEQLIKNKAYEALELVGITEYAFKKMNSLTYCDQKKAELARAIAGNPTLLLLDEPAGGLTMIEASTFGELLKKINNYGITLLVIEHNMPLIMSIVDELVVLNYGSKIAEGSPATVANNSDVIEAYLGEEISYATASQ